MPIYAYKCESCGFAKDVLQKISDPLLSECPSCGQSTFAKQLTAAGFQLKGSGWYATDFKGAKPARRLPQLRRPPLTAVHRPPPHQQHPPNPLKHRRHRAAAVRLVPATPDH